MDETRISRAMAAEAAEDVGRNDSANPTMGDIIAARFGRRDVLKGSLAASAITAVLGPLALAAGGARAQTAPANPTRFKFAEIAAGADERHHVAPGYKAEILIRWGDPVLKDAAPFDPLSQTAEKQKKQFGYNNDFLGYVPINGSSEHGLLCVNHEYTNEELMFPGLGGPQQTKDAAFAKMTPALAAIEMAAHGGSVIEVRRAGGKWGVVGDSRYARRIDADTSMEITGPAAGHDRLKTKADPTGRRVHGMLNNCAGGMTPWGTWLTCEENVHGYFWGKLEESHAEARNYKRMGVPGNWYNWGQYHDRFDIAKEPNEANRFGWVVEIDPLDPASMPKKRTALGRFKHEGSHSIVNKDGRVVVYTGDDERMDYIYRFVTKGTFKPGDRAANMGLLDEGTLSVARYNADGTMDWLPLVFGEGPLTPANGFNSQADVVIEARRAGDLLGATKMDRPEDVEPNPKTGKVYAIMTNNSRRKVGEENPANPRPDNRFGHIIEMTPPDGDHAAAKFTWEMLVRCGDPAIANVGATFSSATSKDGWFGMPDNCAFDAEGRLWIATDGQSLKKTGRADGLWGLETEGAGRGTGRLFFRVPVGAELCGPEFTPDGRTLFLAVQHPAETDNDDKPTTFEKPATRWPDFKDDMPPRPSIVVVTKEDGGVIGS